MTYAPRAVDASAMMAAVICALLTEPRAPSASAHTAYSVARKSSIQKMRGICSWTTSATRTALSGNARMKMTNSARHPATSPFSAGIVTPAARRRRYRKTISGAYARLISQA